MSKKSRKKSSIKMLTKTDPDPLDKKKSAIKKTFFASLGMFLLIAFTTALLCSSFFPMMFSETNAGIIYLALILLFPTLLACYYFYALVMSLIIFIKIIKIRFSTEETLQIKNKKTRFLLYPRARYSHDIVCIILKSEAGRKYYYVTPGIDDSVKKSFKNELTNAKVELTCYKETNIVKNYTVLDSLNSPQSIEIDSQ